MQMTRLDAATFLTQVFPRRFHRDTPKRLGSINAAKLEEALRCGRMLAHSPDLADVLTWAYDYTRSHGQV